MMVAKRVANWLSVCRISGLLEALCSNQIVPKEMERVSWLSQKVVRTNTMHKKVLRQYSVAFSFSASLSCVFSLHTFLSPIVATHACHPLGRRMTKLETR